MATLRARQGDDEAADALYAEAIGCGSNPWVAADAMIGQAAVARRLGDLPRARALLDAAAGHYRHIDLPAGRSPPATQTRPPSSPPTPLKELRPAATRPPNSWPTPP